MSININLTITLDASDLIELRANLAAWRSSLALLAADTDRIPDGINKPPESHPSNPDPDPIPPTAQNGLKRHQTKARPPKIPAPVRAPVLPPIFSATVNGNGNGIDKSHCRYHSSHESPLPADPPHPSNRLPFAEFDKLVRAEMRCLAMDGRLPGHKLWDSERAPGLPTLAAVILRYQANGLVGLAEALGLEPPLSVQKKEPTP